MNNASDHRRAAADRLLALRMRGDLHVVEVAFAGEPAYVVKDPVSGEAFHLTAQEYALLEGLRQPTSLRALQRELQSQFAPRRISIAALQQFVNRLYDQGLLIADNPGQGAELLTRGREQASRSRRASLLQLLSIRVAGFHTGRLIDVLYGLVRWACTWPALLAALALAGYAVLLVTGSAAELAQRLPSLRELARPQLIPLWLTAIVGVKIFHELGHAIVCRHFGARPQEIGVLLLAGAPSLYCDVSDAWRLPSKWQRMAVSAAGMMVELLIASIAVIMWRYAEPGLVSTVCLSLVIVCSVGTLAVNANPLLRYDGYYLLADGLEVPNLAERARGLITGAWRSWLLNEPRQEDPLIGPHKRRALWLYAIASKIYMALVLVGILMLLLKLARPHHLENAVYTLGVIVVAGILLQPISMAGRLLANPSARMRFRWLRLGATIAVLGAITVGILLIPVTRRVTAPVVVIPAKTHPLFAITAGEIEYSSAPGVDVKAGDVIVRLRNPELELAQAEQAGIVQELKTKLEQLRSLQASLSSAAQLLPATAAELADAQAQLAERQAMVDSLTIRAPVAGQLLAPPDRAASQRDADSLRPWQGSPLELRNRGAWIEQGVPLAVIAEHGAWQAWAGVEQVDVPDVQPGQSVRVVADQRPMHILIGRVREVARRARANHSEGDPPSHEEASSLGDNRYHVVEIDLDGADEPLLTGARGTAKIATYQSTVGELVLTNLRRTFQRAF